MINISTNNHSSRLERFFSRRPVTPQETDPAIEFATEVLPYLYRAYLGWKSTVYKLSSQEVQQSLDEDFMIDEWVKMTSLIWSDEVNWDTYHFQIGPFPIPQTKQQVYEAGTSWLHLMLRNTWKSIDSQYPPIAEYDPNYAAGIHCLPKSIWLGRHQIIRTFDLFYLPKRSDVNWSAVWFDYLAPRYEDLSDLILKKGVINVLFENLNITEGLVLDIGCGTGLAKIWEPQGIDLLGVDTSSKMIDFAIKRGEKAIQGDIAEIKPECLLETANESFQGAIMSFVDYWLTEEERIKIFKTVAEILPAGSCFAFNLHLPRTDWKVYYTNLLTQAGFTKIIIPEPININSRDGLKQINFIFAYT